MNTDELRLKIKVAAVLNWWNDMLSYRFPVPMQVPEGYPEPYFVTSARKILKSSGDKS